MASIQLTRFEAEQGDLPDVCMCCGAPATERKRRCFSSYPLWVVLTLLWVFVSGEVSGKSYRKVADKNTRYIRCYTLFCACHRNYFLIRSLIIWGALVVILLLIVGGFFLAIWLVGQDDKSSLDIIFGSFCIGSVVLLLGWLISIPISQAMAIHPTISREYQLILKRVSPAFVKPCVNIAPIVGEMTSASSPCSIWRAEPVTHPARQEFYANTSVPFSAGRGKSLAQLRQLSRSRGTATPQSGHASNTGHERPKR